MSIAATITNLWRWPVKGLGGESLDRVDVREGGLFPFDRAFAIEHGDSCFDPDAPEHVPKARFICMVNQPTTGRMTARYDESSGHILISALDGRTLTVDPTDPTALEELASELVEGRLRGPLKLCAPSRRDTGHGFTDVPQNWISIQNQASIDKVSEAVGTTLDPRRLRGNMLVEGIPAFEEEDLVGQTLEIGTLHVRVEEPINRCRAIDVNPDTSKVDQDLMRVLKGLRDKRSLGLYAVVTKAGSVAVGDEVKTRQP
ncbi:MAG: MOSC domain-containing protein [Pseudomonadota bacterium]